MRACAGGLLANDGYANRNRAWRLSVVPLIDLAWRRVNLSRFDSGGVKGWMQGRIG